MWECRVKLRKWWLIYLTKMSCFGGGLRSNKCPSILYIKPVLLGSYDSWNWIALFRQLRHIARQFTKCAIRRLLIQQRSCRLEVKCNGSDIAFFKSRGSKSSSGSLLGCGYHRQKWSSGGKTREIASRILRRALSLILYPKM